MDFTKCIYNRTQPGCRGRRRHNVDMLMCERHLLLMFGLDKMRVNHETETAYQVVGGFLKPADGIIFKRNDVIFPSRSFFDKTFRPEDLGDAEVLDLQYQMNPVIVEFMRNAQITKSDQPVDKRFMTEITRNLQIEPQNSDWGPFTGQDLINKNAVADITGKFHASQTLIVKNSVNKFMGENLILKGGQLVKLGESKLSICFQYLLNHCLFQGHNLMSLSGRTEMVTDYMMFNCEFVDNIGLVATEDIANPLPLIIAGISTGSVPFYNSIVVTVKKEIKSRKIQDKDLSSQYGLNDSFRGGSPNCHY